MAANLSSDEERFLSMLSAGWPTGRTDIAFDANASYVGRQVGLSPDQAKTVVESLVRTGMLHAREVEGVLLVHPTKATLDRPKVAKASRVSRIVGLLLGR